MQPDWDLVGWVGLAVAVLVGGGFNLLEWWTRPKEEVEEKGKDDDAPRSSQMNAYVVLSKTPPDIEGTVVVGLVGPVEEGKSVRLGRMVHILESEEPPPSAQPEREMETP